MLADVELPVDIHWSAVTMLNADVAAVTDRIIERSRDSRAAYLELIERERERRRSAVPASAAPTSRMPMPGPRKTATR